MLVGVMSFINSKLAACVNVSVNDVCLCATCTGLQRDRHRCDTWDRLWPYWDSLLTEKVNSLLNKIFLPLVVHRDEKCCQLKLFCS